VIDDFFGEEEQGTIFESFSDIALCTLAVALLLVTLLAIDIAQNLTVKMNRSTFSGGLMRPTLHLECTVPDFGKTQTEELAMERLLFAGHPYVAVHLFNPSLALIATDVREGGTVALGQGETFMHQQDLSLYQFMKLAPGIDPGSFMADGQPTALLLPSVLNKQVVYEPSVVDGYRVGANQSVTRNLLASLWPVYEQNTFPSRRPEEYRDARTRIYVETQTFQSPAGEEHYVVIGHSAYRLPDALEDGSLAWLGWFSSGLTEIVFLGETWSDAVNRTNKRIEFFENAGFEEAAEAYRTYAFSPEESPEAESIEGALLEAGYSKALAERRTYDALAQRRVSEALLAGRLMADAEGIIPPLLIYSEAWDAYVQRHEMMQSDPPKWFYAEFLDRLGFDRLAIEEVIR